jgi:hypothetical protein
MRYVCLLAAVRPYLQPAAQRQIGTLLGREAADLEYAVGAQARAFRLAFAAVAIDDRRHLRRLLATIRRRLRD